MSPLLRALNLEVDLEVALCSDLDRVEISANSHKDEAPLAQSNVKVLRLSLQPHQGFTGHSTEAYVAF